MSEESTLDRLRAERGGMLRKLAALETAIRALEEAENPVPSNVRIDEYAGLSKVAAVVKYLKKHGGGQANLEKDIYPELLAGGCNLGRQKDRYFRSLKITVRMNSKKSSHPLTYDSRTLIVGLRAGAAERAKLA